MSSSLDSNSLGAPVAIASGVAQLRPSPLSPNGIGMLEFLVALLIFSAGLMGLMSAQLAGTKASFDAAQRSIATGLARDLLERLRANPAQLAAYCTISLGDAQQRIPVPAADCDMTSCSAQQLVQFDLWQWESWLLGENEQGTEGNRGGLIAPRACVANDGARVAVAISWQNLTSASSEPADACTSKAGPRPVLTPSSISSSAVFVASQAMRPIWVASNPSER